MQEEKPIIPADEVQEKVTIPRRAITVEPVFFFFAISTFIHFLVFNQYLYFAVGRQYNLTSVNNSRAYRCSPRNETTVAASEKSTVDRLQEISTMWNIYISLASGIPSLLLTPFYSTLTDKFGRKWPIICVCVGDITRLAVNTAAMFLDWPIYVFLFTSLVSGLSGSLGSLFAAAFSYLGDITKPEHRAFRITLTECVFLFSGMMAQIGTGFWIKYQPYQWPYGLAGIAATLNLLYTVFLLPEVRRRHPLPAMGCAAVPQRMFKAFTRRDRNTAAMTFAFLGFLINTMQSFTNTVKENYQLGYPFCWGSVLIGVASGLRVFCIIVGMLIAAGVFTRCFRMSPLVVAMIGIVSSFGYNFMMALATDTVVLMCTSLVGIFSLLPIPMIRAFLSLQVSKDEQGAMFASISFAEVLCSLFGSTVINVIYQKTVAWFPGFVFLVLSVVASIALIFIAIALVFQKTRERRHQELIESVVDVNANAEDKEA